jgi:hypothetical protein
MLFSLDWLSENIPAKDKFAVKTSLVVSSTEFCQCKFDEGDIREALSSSSGHGVMIPLNL